MLKLGFVSLMSIYEVLCVHSEYGKQSNLATVQEVQYWQTAATVYILYMYFHYSSVCVIGFRNGEHLLSVHGTLYMYSSYYTYHRQQMFTISKPYYTNNTYISLFSSFPFMPITYHP